jgi:tetratricopeptide (TPR) repeat protein
LWQFKATITGLTKFPEIPLDRTHAVLDEMERRWREGGHSLHAVYEHRHFVARHVGDLDAAEEWYGKWCSAPRDNLSDCDGCDPTAKAIWLAGRGRDEEAVALAEPVLSGRLTCSEQPQGILTVLMKPYLRTGRLNQARDAHRRAYRLHRPNLADLGDVADHLEFCAITGNEPRGVEILERHLGWLDRAPSPYAAMRFAGAGALVLRRAAEAGRSDVVLQRPAHDHRAAGEVDAAALRRELSEVALAIAARFDARNGTDHQTVLVREVLDSEYHTEQVPLSAIAAKRVAPARPVVAAQAEPEPAAVVIPADAGPDDLLDLAEDHLLRGRRPEAATVYEAFDERYAGSELTVLQRGRRADAHGVDAAVRGEVAEAEAAWRSAMELFTEAGDETRRQSTRGRIGRVMCGTGRGEEGLGWVEDAASYLLAHAGPTRWSGALYSLAIACGDVGRVEEGLAALDRADEHIGANLDPTMPAVIAIGRAQFLGMVERLEDARAAAHEATQRSRAVGFADGITHACYLAGLAAERLGDQAGAVAAYDEAIEAATDPQILRRVRAQRAGLLAGSPRAHEVVDDLVETVAECIANSDEEGAARARHALSIAYLNSGRSLDSAEVAEEALAWFLENADEHDPHHVLSVRHLLATTYQRLGQPDEAIAQLELISADCAERANPAGVGQMAEEIGDILDRQDRDAAAALRYLTAAEAFRAAELPIEEFRNRRQHATSLLWSEDIPAALAALEAADELSLALSTGDDARWERASLLYDGARILRNAGRLAEATLRAQGAATAFRDLGFGLQSAHAEMIHAEMLLRDGRPVEAEAAARRGLVDLPVGVEGRDRLTTLLETALEAQGKVFEKGTAPDEGHDLGQGTGGADD